MKKKKDKKDNSLTKFVIFALSAVILYTIVSQIIFIKLGLEYTTLTACFFGVFGGEVLSCALIKIFKLKGVSKENEGICDTSNGDVDNDITGDTGGEEGVG